MAGATGRTEARLSPGNSFEQPVSVTETLCGGADLPINGRQAGPRPRCGWLPRGPRSHSCREALEPSPRAPETHRPWRRRPRRGGKGQRAGQGPTGVGRSGQSGKGGIPAFRESPGSSSLPPDLVFCTCVCTGATPLLIASSSDEKKNTKINGHPRSTPPPARAPTEEMKDKKTPNPPSLPRSPHTPWLWALPACRLDSGQTREQGRLALDGRIPTTSSSTWRLSLHRRARRKSAGGTSLQAFRHYY